MQAGFVVVDKDRRGDVHRIDQYQALLHAALPQALPDVGGDVDEGAAGGDVKPRFLAIAFQAVESSYKALKCSLRT
jgi:hypothetical protein